MTTPPHRHAWLAVMARRAGGLPGGFWGLAAALLAAVVILAVMADTWPGAVAKAEAAGKKPRVEQMAQTWAWRGLAGSTGIFVVLLGTSGWWLFSRTGGGNQKAGAGEGTPPSARSIVPAASFERRWRWALLLALLLAAVALRWPRLGMSLYNDEAYNFSRQVAGYWRDGADGRERHHRPASWAETLWLNTSGNNSQPHSILSRLSYEAWRKISGAPRGEVNERFLRLPALLAGLASLCFLAASLWRMLGSAAGWLALVVGALHPWHLKYATEARGYSLMLLGISAGWFFLDRALKRVAWKDWLGFGGGVFLTAWAFPGAVYFLAVQAALVLGGQMIAWKKGRAAFAEVLRPLAAYLLAVAVALPLMLPLLPGLLQTLKDNPVIRGEMGLAWWRDIGGFALAGCRWADANAASPENICVARELAAHWWAGPALFAAAATALLGAWRLVRLGGAARCLALAGPLGLLLAWAMMSAKGNLLYHWYGIYTLPSWIAMWVAGALAWAGFFKAKAAPAGWVKEAVICGAAALMLAVPVSVAGQWMQRPKQETRGPVLAVRGGIWPHLQKTDALFATAWSVADVYDPSIIVMKTDGKLAELIERARGENRELYVTHSHDSHLAAAMPQTAALLADRALFEPPVLFWGQEEGQYNTYLYRLRRAP